MCFRRRWSWRKKTWTSLRRHEDLYAINLLRVAEFATHHRVWNRVYILRIRSEIGYGKSYILVWNRVRVFRTAQHTPTQKYYEYTPPPPPPGVGLPYCSRLELTFVGSLQKSAVTIINSIVCVILPSWIASTNLIQFIVRQLNSTAAKHTASVLFWSSVTDENGTLPLQRPQTIWWRSGIHVNL